MILIRIFRMHGMISGCVMFRRGMLQGMLMQHRRQQRQLQHHQKGKEWFPRFHGLYDTKRAAGTMLNICDSHS